MHLSDNLSDAELIELGRKALQQERGSLIDNLYRAGMLRDYMKVDLSTEQLRQMWKDYWTNSGR